MTIPTRYRKTIQRSAGHLICTLGPRSGLMKLDSGTRRSAASICRPSPGGADSETHSVEMTRHFCPPGTLVRNPMECFGNANEIITVRTTLAAAYDFLKSVYDLVWISVRIRARAPKKSYEDADPPQKPTQNAIRARLRRAFCF